MLSQDKGRVWHPCPGSLNLMAWKFCAKTLQKEFHRKLSTRWYSQLDQEPERPMPRSRGSFLVGAVNRKLIHAQHL